MDVIWTLGAEADVQTIYQRLELWEEGMGDRFYSEVLTSLQLLRAFPEIGPVVHRAIIRRVLVFNRNYGLFYVRENRGVVLHALLDLRLDPKGIVKRLEDI